MPDIASSKSNLAFLETIGTKDKGDGMAASAKALVELAGFLIITATDNLERKGNKATGNTASSMKIVNLDLSGAKKSLDIQILKTYKFLDQGVKGVEGGAGKYSFKNKFASRKMMLAILKWLKKRSLSGKIKYKAYGTGLETGGKGTTERKNKRINKIVSTAKSRENLAYAVSVNIKKKGIKKTLFFTNAVKATQKEATKKFGAALKLDIINSINGN